MVILPPSLILTKIKWLDITLSIHYNTRKGFPENLPGVPQYTSICFATAPSRLIFITMTSGFWRCGCRGRRRCGKFVSVGGTITFPSCAAPLLRSSGEASSARRQDGRRPVLWPNKNTLESGPVPPRPAYCWLSHCLDWQWKAGVSLIWVPPVTFRVWWWWDKGRW